MTSGHAQGSDRLDAASAVEEQVPASSEEGPAPTDQHIEVLGEASPEQVAALVAVLSGLGGGDAEEPAGPPSRWASRERLVRTPVHPSSGGWRASGLPR